MRKYFSVFTVASLALAACNTNTAPVDRAAGDGGPSLQLGSGLDPDAGAGAVYTITNEAAGNAVLVFARAADGSLTPAGQFATGGTGSGAGLGSQGALALSQDGRWLLAVNAGSHDVSVFQVGPSGLGLTSRTPSGGTVPISVTIAGNLVYVLNAGGTGNISGFTLDREGRLAPIAGSTRGLSAGDVGPAQVAFAPGGRQLVVTEKATNLIDVFPIDRNGVAGPPALVPSTGGTPFGFAFGPRNLVFVTEAAGAGSASSYRLEDGGRLALVSGALATNQGAPCWAVVTADGRFAYTGNGAGSVTGFAVAPDGSLSRLDADGATAAIGGGVNDIALDRSSRYLYVLQVGTIPQIHAYRIDDTGDLVALGPVSGLPASARGLVAR